MSGWESVFLASVLLCLSASCKMPKQFLVGKLWCAEHRREMGTRTKSVTPEGAAGYSSLDWELIKVCPGDSSHLGTPLRWSLCFWNILLHSKSEVGSFSKLVSPVRPGRRPDSAASKAPHPALVTYEASNKGQINLKVSSGAIGLGYLLHHRLTEETRVFSLKVMSSEGCHRTSSPRGKLGSTSTERLTMINISIIEYDIILT